MHAHILFYFILFYFIDRAIFIGPSTIFLKHPYFPVETSVWIPNCKIETSVLLNDLTYSIYTHESWTLGKPYGIKLRCY
jgi:hypothetical protein